MVTARRPPEPTESGKIMKQILAVAAAAILLGTAAAVAEVKQDESCWISRSPEDWEVASLRLGPKLILNNFFFEEKNSLRTKMQVLKVRGL